MLFCKLILVYYLIFIGNVIGKKRPNIVIIIADDLGRNDVGHNGSPQIPTPNIDALGYNGQILNRHYTQHTCTPSRTALLTGQYPIRLGMQGSPLRPGEARYIDPLVKFFPQYLKKLNYKTVAIGKWHMGHYDHTITPNGRGFDYFRGYYNGFCGYFDYILRDTNASGYDLHCQDKPDWESNGIYATHLFTKEAERIIEEHDNSVPLFLYIAHLAGHTGKNGTELENTDPKGADERFSYISEPKRRQYAEVIREMDVSTGKVVKALAEKNMLNNSIILWFSDNGGQTQDLYWGYTNYASNWPLRGQKLVLNEGGVRTAAVIYSPLFHKKNHVYNDVIHITDWLPTLYTAAGGNIKDLGSIDGVNQWRNLNGKTSPDTRPPILLNIDEKLKYDGILSGCGQYKLLNGTFPYATFDLYYGDSGRSLHDPVYDIDAVLKSDVNVAIKGLHLQKPLTEKIILSMRSQTEIVEGPGERARLDCSNYCLFDLINDPTEKVNIKDKNPEIADYLIESLLNYRAQLKPQLNKLPDPKADPKYCNGCWFTWLEKYNPYCS